MYCRHVLLSQFHQLQVQNLGSQQQPKLWKSIIHELCTSVCQQFSSLANLQEITVKGHCQQKVSMFYIKVFDLNWQNIVILRYENARNTV